MSKVMAVNAGSSSLKFKLFEMPEEKVICSGNVERIGHTDAIFGIKYNGESHKEVLNVQDHGVAVKLVMDALIKDQIIESYDEIKAIGHRIVQGGPYFSESTIINKDVLDKIESLIPLSPNHNAAELLGINAFMQVLPTTPGICAFDTAFHQTQSEVDKIFPIPYEYTEKYLIYRYGAHGTSHKYLSEEGLKYVNNNIHSRMIVCHLGSGASITAVKDGKSVATTMGLTPTGGIMMGTRTGDIDPSVFYYVCKQTGKDPETIYQEFSKKSGLKGVSMISDDSRDLENAALKGDKQAILANDLWARRVADFIGQYYVRLGGCDLIIFSAGIGENSSLYRKLVLDNVKEALHLEYDEKINEEIHGGKEGILSTANSAIKVVVIPTNEELMIARDAYNKLLK